MRCLLAVAILSVTSPAFADQQPPPPQNIPPTLLEGSRISGEKLIVPDDVTKTEIQRSGKEKLVGSYKLCIDTNGVPSAIKQLKSTGFGAYDKKIIEKMNDWRYRPYTVNGKAVPVCTAVTFIYTQPANAPEPSLRISADALLKLRTAGSDQIKPDADTIDAMKQRKLTRVVGNFLVCLDTAGEVTHARAIASTGFPTFDTAIIDALENEWKFKPHGIKDTPTAACGPVTISFKP
jgi:hypothetical protein